MAYYIGKRIYDDFSVTDNDNNLIPGLSQSNFTYHLFDSFDNEVSSLIFVMIKELGFGHYRASFIPNKIGPWYLVVYNNIYFPWGKAGSFYVERPTKKRIKPH